MTEDIHDLIEDYIEGILDEKARESFENLLETDVDFRKNYDDYLCINQILKIDQEAILRERMAEIDKEKSVLSKTKYNKYWILASVIASLIIILLVTQARMNKINDVQIAQEFLIQESSAMNRDLNDTKTDQSILENGYLEPLKKINASIRAKNYEEARKLTDAITIDAPIINDNKEWILTLLLYLEKGRKDAEFQKSLNSILDNPSHNCYMLAVNLDQRVNNFWGRLKG
jgi:hypothetical protein